MDIEVTSALADGSWTWRAAGARQPRGVVSHSILPASTKVGDVVRVEVETELEGLNVVALVPTRERGHEPQRIEITPPMPLKPIWIFQVVFIKLFKVTFISSSKIGILP